MNQLLNRLTLMVLILGCWQVYGQRYSFQTIESSRGGLPQTQALAMFQGNRGYLWIGTYSGLARFSGDSWKVYKKPEGLAMNRVQTISQDHLGRLLVGFRQGGVRIQDGEKFRSLVDDPTLFSSNVEAILENRPDKVAM